MKNSWSFVKDSAFVLFCFAVLSAAQCRTNNPTPAKPAPAPGSETAVKPAPDSPPPANTPASKDQGVSKPVSAQPAPGGLPPNNTREVIQGKAPDQARIDSLKRLPDKKEKGG